MNFYIVRLVLVGVGIRVDADIKQEEISLQLIKLFLESDIEETELVLKVIEERLIFYLQQIKYLDKTKPFFFQTKKLEEYYSVTDRLKWIIDILKSIL